MRARVLLGTRRIGSGVASGSEAHFGNRTAKAKIDPTWILRERQLTAHEADKLTRDGEPQPRALEATRVRAVALLETVEKRLPAIRRHTGASIDHGESRCAHFAALDRHADTASIGELDRITGEIHEDLAQARAVRADEARCVGAE
jgi:hypothetical protein